MSGKVIGAQPTLTTQAAAFRWLSDRHLDSSYRLARAILRDPGAAEDATHDAFEQAWRHWSELRDPGRFEQWFGRILINTCRNHLRRVARSHVRDISRELHSVDDDLNRADERQLLREAVAELSPDHQMVVALRFYRDMTVPDIAVLLGVRPGTVQSRLHYAVKHLAVVLGRDGQEGLK